MFFLFRPESVLKDGLELERLEKVLTLISEQRRTLTVSALLLFIAMVRRGSTAESSSMKLREIAEDLQIPLGSLSRQIDALEKSDVRDGVGWLQRSLDEADRRQRRIELTEDGLDIALQIQWILAGYEIHNGVLVKPESEVE